MFSSITGVSRAMLEGQTTGGTMATMERELTVMVRAYLEATAQGAAERMR